MCCCGGDGCCSKSIFEETLVITGARDWGMADHTILSSSMDGYCPPGPRPKFHLNLEVWWQGLESSQTNLSDLWMDPIFLIRS